MDTQKIKQLLTLIANKSKSQTDYGNTKKYIMEIIDYHDSIVSIDVNDVRDLFQEGGIIHIFKVSVDASMENRMILMMAKIMKHAECFEPYNRALVFFFFPEEQPLLIEELQPFSDWIESVAGELRIKWGMATQSTQELRAIIFLQ
ncbi:MAG: hypothetical protein IJ142_05785 [Bacteroidaceae bacterium]|nr:hypothetical protein [Bacteroidaceae bacterium]